MLEPLLPVLRLPAPAELMVLAGEPDELRRHPVELQGGEPLLSLSHGAPVVLLAVDDEARRLDAACVVEGAVSHLLDEVFSPVRLPAADGFGLHEPYVAYSELAHPVADAATRHRGLEPIGVADDPVCGVASVAAAGEPEPRLVDPVLPLQRLVGEVH